MKITSSKSGLRRTENSALEVESFSAAASRRLRNVGTHKLDWSAVQGISSIYCATKLQNFYGTPEAFVLPEHENIFLLSLISQGREHSKKRVCRKWKDFG